MEKKHVKSAWISRGKTDNIKKKPWGTERTWAGFSGIHGKSLFIRKGCRTSFKYHDLKSEVLMVMSGSASVLMGDELSFKDSIEHPFKSETIGPGDSLLIQSQCPYRITAIEDCEIIEIGDNGSDRPVRIEDDYGRVPNK
tara:strand:+ start:87 stop:506 length:420 start_codon:yes stop_codon:yes gene_type:complete